MSTESLALMLAKDRDALATRVELLESALKRAYEALHCSELDEKRDETIELLEGVLHGNERSKVQQYL